MRRKTKQKTGHFNMYSTFSPIEKRKKCRSMRFSFVILLAISETKNETFLVAGLVLAVLPPSTSCIVVAGWIHTTGPSKGPYYVGHDSYCLRTTYTNYNCSSIAESREFVLFLPRKCYYIGTSCI